MLEAVPQANHEELSPLEKKHLQWVNGLLNDVFGSDYEQQPFRSMPVDRQYLEFMAREVWADLDSAGLFPQSPTYDHIDEALTQLQSSLPEGFKIQGTSELRPTADLHRTDIAGWVDSTFKVAEEAGFTNPRQLTIEEE